MHQNVNAMVCNLEWLLLFSFVKYFIFKYSAGNMNYFFNRKKQFYFKVSGYNLKMSQIQMEELMISLFSNSS